MTEPIARRLLHGGVSWTASETATSVEVASTLKDDFVHLFTLRILVVETTRLRLRQRIFAAKTALQLCFVAL